MTKEIYEKPLIDITVIEMESPLCTSTETFNLRQDYETDWA